jgi:DNA-binding NtrC family response regulator
MVSKTGLEYAPGRTIVGRSPAMRKVFRRILQYADSAQPVLITGPIGSGKELTARALHHHSRRKGRFVPVNCAAVSKTLAESEFFGHKRGAFTGALTDKTGWFQEAQDGTLFLDEIGDMPVEQQAMLLRAIQERCVVPVGATHPTDLSFRLVAATNRDLPSAIASGQFREDLFGRLNALPIRMPALAERDGDFPLLVEHFIAKANREESASVVMPRGTALAALERVLGRQDVRALENAIGRLVVVKRRGRVRLKDLEEAEILSAPAGKATVAVRMPEQDAETPIEVSLRFDSSASFTTLMRSVGKAVLDAVLRRHGGRAPSAMRALKLSKSRWYRIRRW